MAVPVDVLVDSGASIVALSYDDASARALNVRDSDYTQRVSTANGLARVAPVMLDRVSIGDITVRNVPAAVTEPGSLPPLCWACRSSAVCSGSTCAPAPWSCRNDALDRGMYAPGSTCRTLPSRGFAVCHSRPS